MQIYDRSLAPNRVECGRFLLYKMIWATVIARRLFVRQLQASCTRQNWPTHVALDAHKYGIVKDSVILLEQVRTIDKSRLREKVCHLDTEAIEKIDTALCVSLSLST